MGIKMKNFKFTDTLTERIMISINSHTNYSSKIARANKSSYVATTKSIIKLENLDLITSEKTGRKNILYLTKKGKRVQELLRELKGLML